MENKTDNFFSKQQLRLNLMLWFRLSRFYNQSIRESNIHLKEWNLTGSQFDILAQIGTNERLSQQELADKLFVTKGNITQLISKMEKNGLVKREQEWKTKYLSLTDKGLTLYHQVVPLQEQFQAAQFESLNQQEKKVLLELLRKIQRNSPRSKE